MEELYKDFAFSGDDWDISFSNNDINFVTGPEEVSQNSQVRLQFLLGEEFHDTRLGVPWLTDMVDPQVSITSKEQILRRTILSTPGALSLEKMTTTVDTVESIASVEFEGTTQNREFFGGSTSA